MLVSLGLGKLGKLLLQLKLFFFYLLHYKYEMCYQAIN